MQAEIVRNQKGEPRLLLTFETDEERDLFADGPTLAPLVETCEGTGEEDDDGTTVGPLLSWSFTFEQDESMTIERVKVIAERLGIPGPDTDEHPEWYEGNCLCRECMEDMAR